ncbi:kinase-like domain-containing protein, partial [Gigaspora rosea]
DLYSGNILQDDLNNAYIADLGLSIMPNIKHKEEKSNGIFGILQYVAPEVLDEGMYTTASDIYSFGIIMWEILYGRLVSYNQDIGPFLQKAICDNGLRPNIIDNSPRDYVNLMKECWNKEPEKRPTAEEICKIFTEWQCDDKIMLELSESDSMIKDSKNIHDETNLEILNGSKFIPYTKSLSQHCYKGKSYLMIFLFKV